MSNLKATTTAGIRRRLEDRRTRGGRRKRKVDELGGNKTRVLCREFECTYTRVNGRVQVIIQCMVKEKEREKTGRKREKEKERYKFHDRYFHKISRPRATVNRPLIAEILCGAWHVFILTGKSLIVAAMGNRRWTAVDRYSYRDKTTSKDYGHVLTARDVRNAIFWEFLTYGSLLLTLCGSKDIPHHTNTTQIHNNVSEKIELLLRCLRQLLKIIEIYLMYMKLRGLYLQTLYTEVISNLIFYDKQKK